MKPIQQFVALTKEKRKLEDRVKEINKEIASLEESVLKYFQEQNLDKVRLEGMTVSLKSEIWARKSPDCPIEEAIKALEEVHLDSYTKPSINYQGLSAYFRDDETRYPEFLKGKIDLNKYFKPVARSV